MASAFSGSMSTNGSTSAATAAARSPAVLVDLTPVVDGTGPSRLLDMIPGRSAKVLTEWLNARDQVFRDRVKVVTMDGFAGYHSAAAKAVPAARTVMDPFHVVHLAAAKLTVCRQRIQQATTGHRGRTGDPLYGIRRTLNTRAELLTDKQKVRLFKAFTANDAHAAVEVTYGVYQRLIAAYEASGKREGKIAMYKLLKSIRAGVPKELPELAQLGRSLWKRRREILAYFDVGACRRPRRGHQRQARTPPRNRPGLPEPQALHLAVTDSLRTAAGSDQCTLNPEGPLKGLSSEFRHVRTEHLNDRVQLLLAPAQQKRNSLREDRPVEQSCHTCPPQSASPDDRVAFLRGRDQLTRHRLSGKASLPAVRRPDQLALRSPRLAGRR